MLRGLVLTLNTLGLRVAVREVLRRILGLGYRYRGVPVESCGCFRALRGMVRKGYDVRGSDGEVVARTPFGEIGVSAPDCALLYVLLEPLEEMYGCVDFDGAVVADVGAFIGETALLFASRGAMRVYAFEPVKAFYGYLVRNIARNSAGGKIIPFNYGVWFRDAVLNVSLMGTSTGLRVNASSPSVEIEVRELGSILEMIYEKEGAIDLVKMDCEGCEYSLLALDEERIRLSKQYIVEIHGCESPLVDKMLQAGYKAEPVLELSEWVKVYLFSVR
jgi:FkbM family methyltransferase